MSLSAKEVLDALDRYSIAAAARQGARPVEVVVTLPYCCVPRESARAIREIAQILAREGYSCTRSRTAVLVMRMSDRTAPARIPDLVCRRAQ